MAPEQQGCSTASAAAAAPLPLRPASSLYHPQNTRPQRCLPLPFSPPRTPTPTPLQLFDVWLEPEVTVHVRQQKCPEELVFESGECRWAAPPGLHAACCHDQ